MGGFTDELPLHTDPDASPRRRLEAPDCGKFFVAGGDVLLFGWIILQIVQFLEAAEGVTDIFPISFANTHEDFIERTIKVDSLRALGSNRLCPCHVPAGSKPSTSTMVGARSICPEIKSLRRPGENEPGIPKDTRDVEIFLVDSKTVAEGIVGPVKSFAMVAGDDDKRIVG